MVVILIVVYIYTETVDNIADMGGFGRTAFIIYLYYRVGYILAGVVVIEESFRRSGAGIASGFS